MTQPARLLVVGGGSIGERHVRCFQQAGDVEVSLCDSQPAIRHALAERYQLAETYADFAVACDAGPQLAVIATPAHLHVSMARALVERGVPVLIEKPLSTSTEQVDELIALAERRRVPAGLAYVYRAHPALAAMRAAILAGEFGRPLQLVAVSGQHFPHYRPAYREIYYRDRATGGGAIQDALTHVVNAAEWLVGPVTQLAADAAHLALEGVAVEDTVNLLARHGKLLASYSLNQHQPANESSLTVICEQGMARFAMHRGEWSFVHQPDQPWQVVEAPQLARDALFIRQAAAFLACARDGAAPLCSLSEGAQTLRVNLAALRSCQSRGWVTVE